MLVASNRCTFCIYMYMHTVTGEGAGVTCLDFGYGRAAGVPRPHPIHILY